MSKGLWFEKWEKNTGVKEKYCSGRVIVRLQEIYPVVHGEATFFLPAFSIFLSWRRGMSGRLKIGGHSKWSLAPHTPVINYPVKQLLLWAHQ